MGWGRTEGRGGPGPGRTLGREEAGRGRGKPAGSAQTRHPQWGQSRGLSFLHASSPSPPLSPTPSAAPRGPGPRLPVEQGGTELCSRVAPGRAGRPPCPSVGMAGPEWTLSGRCRGDPLAGGEPRELEGHRTIRWRLGGSTEHVWCDKAGSGCIGLPGCSGKMLIPGPRPRGQRWGGAQESAFYHDSV